jgi:DNA-binding CsgD family transcriptional regulator
MTDKKLIVIGCDDTATSSAILKSMEGAAFFSPDIVFASRVPDLLQIVNSLNPHLVIFCFRTNQAVLRDFDKHVQKVGMPVLCLVRKLESEVLSWGKDSIVFTYPLEHIQNKEYIASRINSIFLLRAEPQPAGITLASAAIRQAETRDLSRYAMELDQKAEILLKVKNKIAELYARVDDPVRAELMSIVNAIKISANDNHFWADFKLYFQQTNPDFLRVLARKHPLLTPIDLKYCCYLKMNMSNDDIRNLLGINQESVRTHKYRLKKKLALSKNQDLTNYLRVVV